MSLVKEREKYFKKRQKEFFEELKTDIKNGKKWTKKIYKLDLERIGLEISNVAYFLLKHNITSSIVFITKTDLPYYVINFYDSEEEYERSIKDINKNYKKEKDGELLFENRGLEFKNIRLEKEIDAYESVFSLLVLMLFLGTLGFMLLRG